MRERVATEDYNIGDEAGRYVVAVENANSGPEIIISRSLPNFVRRLVLGWVSGRGPNGRHQSDLTGGWVPHKIVSGQRDVKRLTRWVHCVGRAKFRVKNIVRELNQERGGGVTISQVGARPARIRGRGVKPSQNPNHHHDADGKPYK